MSLGRSRKICVLGMNHEIRASLARITLVYARAFRGLCVNSILWTRTKVQVDTLMSKL